MTVMASPVLLKTGHVMRSKPREAAIPWGCGQAGAIFFWDHKSPQKAFVFLDVRLPST
jgi:hypothetical protein